MKFAGLMVLSLVIMACTKPSAKTPDADKLGQIGKFKTPSPMLLKSGCVVQINRPPVPTRNGNDQMYLINGVYSVGNCADKDRPQKGDMVFESDIVKNYE